MSATVVRPRYAIIEAPAILSLKPTGVERLLSRGLAERIAAPRATPAYSAERDAETLTLNAAAITSWSPVLADVCEDVLNTGELPVVLPGAAIGFNISQESTADAVVRVMGGQSDEAARAKSGHARAPCPTSLNSYVYRPTS